MSSGFLKTGEASGIPIIKNLLNSTTQNKRFTFIDCPPGSACIVMESIRDADYCILVAEPTLFGVHNLQMVDQLVRLFEKPYGIVLNKCLDGDNPAEKFQIKTAVCVNKFDTNIENTVKIESFCHNLPYVGRIPFDSVAVQAINNGQSIVDRDCAAGRAVKEVFDKIIKLLFSER